MYQTRHPAKLNKKMTPWSKWSMIFYGMGRLIKLNKKMTPLIKMVNDFLIKWAFNQLGQKQMTCP